MKYLFILIVMGALLSILARPTIGVEPVFSHPEKIEFFIPYSSQAPFGKWEPPWNVACEETSAIMVNAYYEAKTKLTPGTVHNEILAITKWEDSMLGYNADSNATDTKKFIDTFYEFKTVIKTNPTLEEIKKELRAGRPVISLHRKDVLYQQKSLKNFYHMMVIRGYDDKENEFIVNDPARRDIKRFSYTAIMNSLNDYNKKTKRADGPPTVLFTSQN